MALAWPLAVGVGPGVVAAQVAPSATRLSIQTPSDARVWPAPPAQARIRYVGSLDPASTRGKPSLFVRAWHALVGGREEPEMLQPYGVAVDPAGRVLVADTFGHAIHVLDPRKPKYSSIRVDGGSLIGVALAGDRLVVTDSASGRVICLDDRGRTRWTLGPGDGFERPTGVVVAGDRVYVADTLANRIVIVGLGGKVLGSFGRRGDGPGEFNFPTNLARTIDGRLLVTDAMNFRVQVFDADGRFLRTFGRLGDGSGDFDKPKGVAVDSDGHIYVVEGISDVVQVFDDSGQFLLAFGGSGSGAGQLWLPSGIAIANGRIYVADSANRRIQVYQYLGARQ
ncbi:MAG: 6-bladed beta-propeller [Acidobacteriota bacterium]